jgi:hypothetical protein
MEMLKRHVALGLPTANTQCYFGLYPARLKASLGPCLVMPKPKRHLALGLQHRGSMPSATWHLDYSSSGGNPNTTCSNMVFLIVIAVFENLLMTIIIFMFL